MSHVTDMSDLFRDAALFNSDISKWDVSAVTTMQGMFYGARSFNSDISAWQLSPSCRNYCTTGAVSPGCNRHCFTVCFAHAPHVRILAF